MDLGQRAPRGPLPHPSTSFGVGFESFTTTDVRRAAGERRDTPTVWWLALSDVEHDMASAAASLTAAERASASSLRHEPSRRAYLVAHVLLRTVLSAMHGLSPLQVALGRSPCSTCGEAHGRPQALAPVGAARTRFSLTRTEDVVAVLTAPRGEVGVDAERTVAPRVASSLLPRMHPAEATEISQRPPHKRPIELTRIWVRKEALLKALGTGLARDTRLDYTGDERLDLRPPGWRLGDAPIAGSHRLGVCVPSDVPVVHEVRVASGL